LEEILFDAPELLVEKVIGLVNDAHKDVDRDFRGAGF
jgi:hypothetical protein